MEAGSVSDSMVEMNHLLLPQDTNNLGTAFGGTIMAWIDLCASMVAQRHARSVVVTASMDRIDFITPIRAGHHVTLKGMVNYVGRSSMEIGVRVESEDPLTGIRGHAASAYLTFVALGEGGKPRSVPPLLLSTRLERLRYDEAKARRNQRLLLAEERRKLAHAHAAPCD